MCYAKLFSLFLYICFMTTIHAMAQRFAAVNFDQIARDSIEATKGSIVSFNQQNLRKGFKVDGSRIGTYASIPYAAKKFNQSGDAGFGFIDLFLTGAWSENIGVIVNSKSFTTFSTDSKESLLSGIYGNDIEGLPDAYRPQYTEIIYPVLFGKLKAVTVGG